MQSKFSEREVVPVALDTQVFEFDREIYSYTDNTAPVIEPERRPDQEKETEVVEFPGRERKKKTEVRPQRHPVRFLLNALGYGIFIGICALVVFSQLTMAELTDQINSAQEELREKQSIQVQLNMIAAGKMNGTQVEEYAENVLGMVKMKNSQVTYLSVAGGDKGTVVQAAEGNSWIDQGLARIRAWLSR